MRKEGKHCMLQKDFRGNVPRLHPTVRGAETAVVIGDVTLGENVNVWYGAVIRGDEAPITIGAGTNIQDNAVLHCDRDIPLSLGENVIVGHGSILHSCTVGSGCLIGMGAALLTGCVVGEGSIIGGGALVTGKTVIPPGSMVMGTPARVIRSLHPDEQEAILVNCQEYMDAAREQLAPIIQQEDTSR